MRFRFREWANRCVNGARFTGAEHALYASTYIVLQGLCCVLVGFAAEWLCSAIPGSGLRQSLPVAEQGHAAASIKMENRIEPR